MPCMNQVYGKLREVFFVSSWIIACAWRWWNYWHFCKADKLCMRYIRYRYLVLLVLVTLYNIYIVTHYHLQFCFCLLRTLLVSCCCAVCYVNLATTTCEIYFWMISINKYELISGGRYRFGLTYKLCFRGESIYHWHLFLKSAMLTKNNMHFGELVVNFCKLWSKLLVNVNISNFGLEPLDIECP